MKRILILGAGGMAGHVMAEYLAQESELAIIRCARRPITPNTIVMDVTDFRKVEEMLRDIHPDIVVNCVGMLVQASQNRVDQAILINSYLPHFLSSLGSRDGFQLIHISTDCVFSGKRGGYAEDDFRDGNTPYARTKALGEVINERDLTIRTSIIGPELKANGTGLLHWFLTQKGRVKGFTNVYWSGVTTLELARVVNDCIQCNATGLFHVTTLPKISKYDLLVEFQKIWGHSQIEIEPYTNYYSDKSLITRRKDLSIHPLPTYPAMLRELRIFMENHQEWYPHYTL